MIALSGDGKWIVSTGRLGTTVWNRGTRQIAYTVNSKSAYVATLDVSPDSIKFATGSSNKTVIIWAISNGRRLVVLGPHVNVVTAVRFSPDGDRVAVAVPGQGLHIYEAYGGQSLRFIEAECSRLNGLVWLGDSIHIYTLSGSSIKCLHGDKFETLSEWAIPGSLIHDPNGSSGIALPRNGRFIASFAGRVVTFWNTSTRVRLGPLFEHLQVDNLYSIALSPDSNYVATGNNDGMIILRDLKDIIPSSLRVDHTCQFSRLVSCVIRLNAKIGSEMLRTPWLSSLNQILQA